MGYNNEFMVIDPETGIVRDINVINGFCGAYCFHDLQTDLAIGYGWNLTDDNHEVVGWCNLIAGDLNMTIEIDIDANSVLYAGLTELTVAGLILGALGPDEAALAAAGVSEEVIQSLQWRFIAAKAGAAIGVGLFGYEMIKDTITGDLTHMFEHPWLQVKVNGNTVYSQIFVAPPSISDVNL